MSKRWGNCSLCSGTGWIETAGNVRYRCGDCDFSYQNTARETAVIAAFSARETRRQRMVRIALEIEAQKNAARL